MVQILNWLQVGLNLIKTLQDDSLNLCKQFQVRQNKVDDHILSILLRAYVILVFHTVFRDSHVCYTNHFADCFIISNGKAHMLSNSVSLSTMCVVY